MTSVVFILELIRQTTHMHALVQRDLSNAGVSGISPNLFDVAPSAVPVWLLWLGVLSACFLVVSRLYRSQLGRTVSATVRAGTLTWAATFGIAWLSFLAFELVTAESATVALAGSWIESQIVAGVAVWWPDPPRDSPGA